MGLVFAVTIKLSPLSANIRPLPSIEASAPMTEHAEFMSTSKSEFYIDGF